MGFMMVKVMSLCGGIVELLVFLFMWEFKLVIFFVWVFVIVMILRYVYIIVMIGIMYVIKNVKIEYGEVEFYVI